MDIIDPEHYKVLYMLQKIAATSDLEAGHNSTKFILKPYFNVHPDLGSAVRCSKTYPTACLDNHRFCRLLLTQQAS